MTTDCEPISDTLYEQLPPLHLGEVHSHFLMDTGGYQVNFPLLIRKAKAFLEVSQWASTVTCPTTGPRQAENIQFVQPPWQEAARVQASNVCPRERENCGACGV